MATTTKPTVTVPLGGRPQAPVEGSKTPPVVWWAWVGGAMVLAMTYVIVRWVTGPYFKTVKPGPTKLPAGQSAALTGIQIGGCALALFCIYWTLVRPWLKERRVASEGLLVTAYGLLYFQDPFSNGINYWFLYNDHLWNRGSWIPYLPLFNGYEGTPGHMWAEPIFGMGPGYIYFWVIGVWAGTVAFKFAKRRLPRLGMPGALVVCYLGIFLFDTVLEAFVWMRTGFFVYPGGQGPRIFSGSYLAFPLVEPAMIGMLLTPYVLLRHYRDDRGYTFVERGIDNVKVGTVGKTVIRFLALVAVSQLFYFFSYNVWAIQVGAHDVAYSKTVMQHSDFLNGLCGQGTNRACPGPAVPNARPGSAYVNVRGGISVPKGTKLPASVSIVK